MPGEQATHGVLLCLSLSDFPEGHALQVVELERSNPGRQRTHGVAGSASSSKKVLEQAVQEVSLRLSRSSVPFSQR
jgi:hypothetical protein